MQALNTVIKLDKITLRIIKLHSVKCVSRRGQWSVVCASSKGSNYV